jgi:hypothetical protein
MSQAAAERAFDFSQPRLHDSRWWHRLHIVLGQIRNRNERETLVLAHQEACTRLLRSVGDTRQLDNLVSLIYHAIERSYLPWQVKETGEVSIRQQATDAWKQAFGDPNDPAVAAKIKATANALLNRRSTRK